MQRWVRRWAITITWDSPHHSPLGVTRYSAQVSTPQELRALVDAARADPHVTSFPYRSVRVLEGAPPTRCRRGHPYQGGSATRAGVDHIECSCGGHLVLACRWEGCHEITIDPPPEVDCQPRSRPRQQPGRH